MINAKDLERVGHDLGLNLEADFDPIGGWHPRLEGDGWPCGSLFREEGNVLYALARALGGPVLELGSHYGCSASHIAAGLLHGRITCVDFNGGDGNMIPAELLPKVEFVRGDIDKWAPPAGQRFRLIFEDGIHSKEQVFRVWSHARDWLAPGGVIVSHDALHFLVGNDVMGGIRQAGFEPHTYLFPPSDCGLAVWRNQ